MTSTIKKLEGRFTGNLGKVSESLVHDEIIKRGLIQSVVMYFHEQPTETNKVDLSKMEEYYDLRKLYFDFYGNLNLLEMNSFIKIPNRIFSR